MNIFNSFQSKLKTSGVESNLPLSQLSESHNLAIFEFALINRRHCFRASHDSEKLRLFLSLGKADFEAQLG